MQPQRTPIASSSLLWDTLAALTVRMAHVGCMRSMPPDCVSSRTHCSSASSMLRWKYSCFQERLYPDVCSSGGQRKASQDSGSMALACSAVCGGGEFHACQKALGASLKGPALTGAASNFVLQKRAKAGWADFKWHRYGFW